MLNRQKYLLAQIRAFGGECGKLNLIKGLFYLCRKELKENLYDFHPYLYGPYSETIYADLRSLERQNFLNVFTSKVKTNLTDQAWKEISESIKSADLKKIELIASTFKKKNFSETIEKVYKEFPYFAINNKKIGCKYKKYDPRRQKANQAPVIFTIGYEGISIDEFFNRLIQKNIQVLVDIRNNPWSMKYGFTGKTLQRLCENRGITYISIKSLGIESQKRKNLKNFNDYKKLFKEFENNHMPNVKNELASLRSILEKGNRIGLLCFEKDHNYCHRTIVGKHLYKFCNREYELQHV